METKFIGLDGYNEIESINFSKKKKVEQISTAKKTIRFAKRLSVYIVKDVQKKIKKSSKHKNLHHHNKSKNRNCYAKNSNNKNVKNVKKYYNAYNSGDNSLRKAMMYELLTEVPQDNRKKYTQTKHRPIKQKAALVSAACFSAILFSCMTGANALNISNNTKNNITEKTSSSQTEIFAPNLENQNSTETFLINNESPATCDEVSTQISKTLTQAVLNDNIITKTFALVIDGETIGYTNNLYALNSALDNVLKSYRANYDETTTTEFANSVETVAGNYENVQLMTADELIALAENKFSISLSTDILYDITVSCDVDIEYDDTKDSSFSEVKSEGKDGKATITLRTTFVDGIQTDCIETNRKITQEPVNKVVIAGSKEKTETSNTSNEYYGNRTSFGWPVPYTTYITSYYGYRWGTTHTGIDISDCNIYGQDIVASEGGTVEWAGYDNSGYGNYVVINHNNGYKTLYGHCSSLAVSTGETVNKGQTIAYIGSTGDSTGPHLHFEIREGDTRLDPMDFL